MNIKPLHDVSVPCDTEPKSDIIPDELLRWNVSYISPSSIKVPLNYYITNKILLTEDFLKKKKPPVVARFGSIVHQLIDEVYFQKFDIKEVLQSIYRDLKKNHQGYDEKDFYKLDVFKDKFLTVYENLAEALRELNITKCDLETPIDLELPNLLIPINGYTDGRTKTHVLEFKTKWNRIREVAPCYNVYKITKNGDWSKTKRVFKFEYEANEYAESLDCDSKIIFEDKHFKCDSPPVVKEPYSNDIMQLALYCRATGLKPILIYATERDFKIFTSDNCEALQPQSLNEYVEKARRIALARQGLLLLAKDKQQLVSLIEPPDLSEFWWDLGDDVITEVRKLWKI